MGRVSYREPPNPGAVFARRTVSTSKNRSRPVRTLHLGHPSRRSGLMRAGISLPRGHWRATRLAVTYFLPRCSLIVGYGQDFCHLHPPSLLIVTYITHH
jgi:hypothetical protein